MHVLFCFERIEGVSCDGMICWRGQFVRYVLRAMPMALRREMMQLYDSFLLIYSSENVMVTTLRLSLAARWE